MEVYRDDQKKLIQIWLTRQESQDETLQSRLKPMYAQWKAKKYMVAVYHSGKENLYRSTLDLLAYNKKHCAELAVKREKEQTAKSQAQMQL